MDKIHSIFNNIITYLQEHYNQTTPIEKFTPIKICNVVVIAGEIFGIILYKSYGIIIENDDDNWFINENNSFSNKWLTDFYKISKIAKEYLEQNGKLIYQHTYEI